MSTGELAYLTLVLAAFAFFSAVMIKATRS